MANYGKRVNVFSSSGEDPVLELSDGEFRVLEEIYGHSLSAAAREALIGHAENYFHWRIAELNSDSFQEVRRLFEKIKDAVSGLHRFAYGELTPMTDAGSVLNGILEDHLGKFPVQMRENQLLLFDPSDDDNEGKRVDLGGAMLTITPDFDFLTSVGISLGCVLAKVEEDIASQEADDNNHGFVPGRAFPRWLLNMRGWAIENGFRYGAFTAEGFPSQFSRLLFEVNGYFGTHARGEDWKLKELKDPVASVEALADRLKRVSRSAVKVSTKKQIGANARA